MATIRDIHLFVLEKTFNKVKEDFLAFEQKICHTHKSELEEQPGFEGFYGSWNRFYLSDEYQRKDFYSFQTGRASPILNLKSEDVDIDHPVFDLFIQKLINEEERLSKLTIENFKVEKLDIGDHATFGVNEINCSYIPAFLHDVISSAQNNASISFLLDDFLENENIKSLVKAVSVDASVTSIEQIQEKIMSFPISERIKLERKLVNAKEKPIYSPNGNNQTVLASIFIYQFDTVGLLNPVFKYTNTDIYEMAVNNDAISVDFDESTFQKKLRDYLNIKSQGRN